MRRFLAVCILSILTAKCWGGNGNWSKVNPVRRASCDAQICGQCGAAANQCGCRVSPPCDHPCFPPREGPPPEEDNPPREGPPEDEFVTRETGFFQAPPPTGAVQGPSRGFGIRGGGLIFHEFRCQLPSIELPSFHRVHEGARMRMRAAEAPWVSTGFETQRVGPPSDTTEPTSPRDAPPEDSCQKSRQAPRSPPEESCSETKREYEQKLDELNRKIKECEELQNCIKNCLDRHSDQSKGAENQSSGTSPMPVIDDTTPMKRIPPPVPDVSRSNLEGIRPATYNHPIVEPFKPAMRRLPPVWSK